MGQRRENSETMVSPTEATSIEAGRLVNSAMEPHTTGPMASEPIKNVRKTAMPRERIQLGRAVYAAIWAQVITVIQAPPQIHRAIRATIWLCTSAATVGHC